MQLGLAGRLLAFEHLLDQVDAAARAIELVAEQLVGGACGVAEAAVHTLAQDGLGLAAFGGVHEFGRELGLHWLQVRIKPAAVEDARRIELTLEFTLDPQQDGS